jgi:SPP1 gp7 family putative phage head morphogenesis protein
VTRRTANYWQRRAEARLIAIERGTEPYLRRIYQLNLGVVDSIRGDIERIIGNFAKHSQLTREEAISFLSETISETERQRIIAMCAGIEDKATKARLMAKVNAPAYRARIDRLLAIEVSAQARMALLAPRQIDTMTSGLHKAGLEMYSRTMFDLQRGAGLGFSFAGVTDAQIESVMREPWSGGHYSSRVWRNTQIVAERIRDTVEQNMITGKSWRRSLNAVTDQALIDSNYAASRIMRTETAYVTNEIEALAYEEVGLDEYKYVATLDGRTSDVCRELDGKKFKLRDREVGKNYPPMHPHCRSTTVAVIDGFDMSELQRRARNPETGETYKVPANMTYREWERGSQTTIAAPIDARNPGEGKASSIYWGDAILSKKQRRLNEMLPEAGAQIEVRKRDASMKDLAALTAENECEYALFTKGGRRMIFRGSKANAEVSEVQLKKLATEGWKFSGHTHPGRGHMVRLSSQGDRNVLKLFKQERSVIYDSAGIYRIFAWEEE